MFYFFSRFLIRLALPIYLRKLIVVNAGRVPRNRPVLMASNHSGSFFDAVVIGASLPQAIHTLTRGDAFKKPKAAFWLRQINLIPVFRASEGRQNVLNLDVTTKESMDALKQGDSVVIFSEGVCVNEWKLRPLGKGTARMAHHAWYGEGGFPDMLVVPTGVNYEHFRGTDKRVSVRFGEAIEKKDIKTSPEDYEKWLREFNEILQVKMNEEILTIPPEADRSERGAAMNRFFGANSNPEKGNALFRLIGGLGRAIHRPLYRFYTKKIAKMTARTVFYDSALFGMMVYTYPVLVTLLSILVGIVAGFPFGFLTFLLLPLLAWMGNRYR